MRVALLVLALASGCYQSHEPPPTRRDAAVDAPISIDAPIALDDAGSCGGETEVSFFLVRSVGAGVYLNLTNSHVFGFGDCPTGGILLDFDAGPPSSPPTVQVTIPVPGDAPIDREGDWPCLVRAVVGDETVVQSCVLYGRITGYALRGFYVQLSGMLGGVGYSAAGDVRAPVCDLQICI